MTNKLTAEHLTEAHKFGSLFFGEEDIKLILGIHSLTEEAEIEFRKAVKVGRLKSNAEYREAVARVAKEGSAPAQELLYKIINNAEFDALRDGQ